MGINQHSGFDPAGLQRLVGAVERDVENSVYDGAQLIVARDGEIAVDATIGYADREQDRAVAPDDVFKIFSLTKAFINALVLQALDRGDLTLQTRVVDVIPEFWGKDLFRSARKDRVNVGHLLTHRAGLPATPQPLPYEQLPDLAATVAAICELDVVGEPGTTLNYSPTVNHALLGEIVRRVAGGDISLRDLLQRDLFGPLGMTSTSLGSTPDLEKRMVPVISHYPEGGWLTNEDVQRVARAISMEDSEMPWVGGVSSSADIFRFAEMLRRGGELGGTRLLSPAVIDKATRLWTGDALNDLYKLLADARGWEVPPGNFGLGFALAGSGLTVSQFGNLSSPRTFGNFGAGSTLFWVDPERQITFVCLTARVIEESDNILRFQRLSDLVQSAALR
jgi:CubicO group peptidase (beta-lactamase class C family)